MASENVQAPKQEGYRIHIGNLAYNSTEEQVREILAKAGGTITAVVLPLKFGKKPGGFAFVDYEKEEDAKAAVEKLNGTELNGRELRFDPARSKEESDARRAEAREKRDAARAARDAEKIAAGETTAVTDGEATKEKGERKRRPSKKRAPRRRQPGEEGEEGTTAEAVEGTGAPAAASKSRRNRKPKEPKEARIDAAEGDAEATPEKAKPKEKRERKPREKKMEPSGEQSKTGIFVANLPFEVDDAALAAIFTNLSINVKSAKVATRSVRPRDKTQAPSRRSRGYGFVEVEDAAQQKEAVDKVQGTLVGERQLSVRVANEMRPIEKAEGEVTQAAAAEAAATPA